MNNQYQTLNLIEAAMFLHMSPAVLRQKARAGIIHGAKTRQMLGFSGK